MKRKALIIGSPQKGSGANYLPGVEKDVENYYTYLLSALGGAWRPDEITILIDPDKTSVLIQRDRLRAVDYSFVVFAGHGSHPKAGGPTLVDLRRDVSLSEDELKIGAARHTLILDCCRKLERDISMEALVAKSASFSEARSLSLTNCRLYFDQQVTKCSSGLVTLYACAVDETSNESGTTGGHYTSSLMRTATEWKGDMRSSLGSLSITEAHDHAAEIVARRSGGRQNPQKDSPRTTPHFPFAVVA